MFMRWLFCGSICLLPSGFGVIADELSGPVLREAESAWKEYIEQMEQSRYRIVGRFRHEVRTTGDVIFDNRFEHRMCRDNALTIGDSADGTSQSVRAANQHYRFEATKSRAEEWQREDLFVPFSTNPADAFGISPEDPVARRGAFASSAHASAMKALCRGVLLWENWFPAMVRSSDFSIVSVDEFMRDGQTLVKLQFSYSPSKWEANVPRDGWVVLDPQLQWLIVEAKTQGEWGGGSQRGTLEILNTYTENQTGLPLIRRQEIVIRVPEDGTEVDDLWTHEYEEYLEAECDPKNYMLSAFGLPEPQLDRSADVAASRRRFLFIVGNLLVIAAIGLYIWGARAQRST